MNKYYKCYILTKKDKKLNFIDLLKLIINEILKIIIFNALTLFINYLKINQFIYH